MLPSDAPITRLRDAIDSVTDGFALFDREDRLVLFNRAFLHLVPRLADALVPGVGLHRLVALVRERCPMQLLDQGRPHGRRPDWLTDRATMPQRLHLRMTEGRVAEVCLTAMEDGGFVAVLTDQTDRLKAEADRDRFFELSVDMMCVCGLDTRIQRINPAVQHMLGHTPESLTGRSFLRFVHPDDIPVLLKMGAEFLEGTPVLDFETRFLRKDGGVRWVQLNASHADGLVYAVARDITDRRQREEMLRWRDAQLSEAQRIARMGDWYWDFARDAGGWSDELFRLHDIPRNGRPYPSQEEIHKAIHPEDLPGLLQTIGRAVQNRTTFQAQFRAIARGELRHMITQGRVEEGPDGTPKALIGITQDITEQVNDKLALLEAKDMAEAANRAKSDFLASMSHELRTPLNAIIGFSELISQEILGPLNNSRYMGYVRDIEASGRHLLSLINDMLDLAKIEAGRYDLREERVVVADALEEVLRLVSATAAAKGLSLAQFTPLDLPVLLGDRRALRQMLLNLLSNAIKFTPTGGMVRIRAESGRDGLDITVLDTGVGIPADRLDSLALPFVQVENVLTKQNPGAGIGLYITRSLMEMHGGRLVIDSQNGGGTAVTLHFPPDRCL